VLRYRSRISGPLLDRIDLHVEVPTMRESELADAPAGEPSSAVWARVKVARTIADLGDRPGVGAAEVAEAIAYRHADRAASC